MNQNLPPGNELGFFYGYASVFDTVDGQGDVVKKGAFLRSLFLWEQKGERPKLLWSHDFSSPIGRILHLEEDNHGLFIKAELIQGVQRAREAHALIQGGGLSGLSIGFQIKKSYQDRLRQCRVIEEVDLYEVSLVVLPANAGAVVC